MPSAVPSKKDAERHLNFLRNYAQEHELMAVFLIAQNGDFMAGTCHLSPPWCALETTGLGVTVKSQPQSGAERLEWYQKIVDTLAALEAMHRTTEANLAELKGLGQFLAKEAARMGLKIKRIDGPPMS